MNEKVRKRLRILACLLFCGYLLLLCYFLFFADNMGRTYGRAYHYNLMPFRELGRFWKYRKSLGFIPVFLNLVGNVLVFVPYGAFLPLLVHWFRRFWYVTLLSFDFSLLVEVIQLIFKVGSFDVDDLILNTIGGAIGYLAFAMANVFQNRHLRGK